MKTNKCCQKATYSSWVCFQPVLQTSHSVYHLNLKQNMKNYLLYKGDIMFWSSKFCLTTEMKKIHTHSLYVICKSPSLKFTFYLFKNKDKAAFCLPFFGSLGLGILEGKLPGKPSHQESPNIIMLDKPTHTRRVNLSEHSAPTRRSNGALELHAPKEENNGPIPTRRHRDHTFTHWKKGWKDDSIRTYSTTERAIRNHHSLGTLYQQTWAF